MIQLHTHSFFSQILFHCKLLQDIECGSLCVYILSCSVVPNSFGVPWTVTHQAPLSMRFSRQEYWSGLPFFTPRDLPDPGIKHESLASPALAGRFFATSTTWETIVAAPVYIPTNSVVRFPLLHTLSSNYC